MSERGAGKTERKPKVALLVNIVAPYRVPVYEALGEQFDVRIFYSGSESNRTTWQGTLSGLSNCKAKRSWGFTFTRRIKRGSNAFDNRYVHFNPGFLFDLIRTRPDAVISIEMGFRSLVAMFYGAIARKPVWISSEGTIHTEMKAGRFKRMLRRFFAKRAKRWITYGRTSTDYLVSIGVPLDRVLQVQNCVDESLFSAGVEPSLDIKPKPVLLVVGHLIGLKGIDRLLDAAATVQREGREFSLVFVGDGPSKQAYVDQVAESGTRGVVFEPTRKPAEMPAIYRSADCLIFPTLDDVWGLVVNEAMWSGVPVMGSIYAGCAAELLPECNRFDPLEPSSMESAVRNAACGKVAKPDLAVLKPYREVAGLIADDLQIRVKA
jgi:glycosyltransferase involved in cell wall biosynthesis